MKSNLKIKKLSLIFFILITFLLTIFLLAPKCSVFAESNNKFKPKNISITNSDFMDTYSSYSLQSPSGWTGATLDSNIYTDNIKSGVLKLTASKLLTNDKKLLKNSGLDIFYSGNNYPHTIFNTQNYNNDTNVLLINSENSRGAYGYKSSSFTLNQNSQYEVSVWVKTSNITDGGASIAIDGLDKPVLFSNINTYKNFENLNNNYNWMNYKFYLNNNGIKAYTATINLRLGSIAKTSANEDNNFSKVKLATGFAMFDQITVRELPADIYNILTNNIINSNNDTTNIIEETSNNILKYDFLNEVNSNDPMYIKNGDFNSDLKPDNWTLNYGSSGKRININEYTKYNISNNPNVPFSNNNVLALSTFSNSNGNGYYKNDAMSFKSNDLIAKKNKYYMISVWSYVDNVSGGTGASIHVTGKSNIADNKYKLDVKIDNLTNNTSTDSARYAWKQSIFKIKPSTIDDMKINLELWLGSKNTKSKGTVFFSDIKVYEVKYSQYKDITGTEVSFDTSSSSETSSIKNSDFTTYTSKNTENTAPFSPNDWTYINASNSGTTGASTHKIDDQGVVSGVVSSQKEIYNEENKYFGNYPFPISPGNNVIGNMLLIESKTKTAAGYRTSNFSIEANKTKKLTLDIYTDYMNNSDYGANLILRNNTNVIANIEKINTSGKFKTYTFYIRSSNNEMSLLNLEIWLGLFDKKYNNTKLSSGYVFIKNIQISDLATNEKFETLQQNYYENQINNSYKINSNYTVFDATKYSDSTLQNYFNFDVYDNSYLKTVYDWTCKSSTSSTDSYEYGVFNGNNLAANGDPTSSLPNNYNNGNNASGPFVLALHNNKADSTTLSSNETYTTEASNYYKITVLMKVNIPTFYINGLNRNSGASIKITGLNEADSNYNDFVIDNIIDTHDYTKGPDKNNFRKFTFYIATGNYAPKLNVEFNLGSNNGKSTGWIFINSIKYEKITSADYPKVLKTPNSYKIDMGSQNNNPNNNTSNNSTSMNWLGTSTLVFSIAFIIAMLAVFIRRFIDFNKAHKAIEPEQIEKASYDRENIIKDKKIKLIPSDTKNNFDQIELDYDAFDEEIEEEKPNINKQNKNKVSIKSKEDKIEIESKEETQKEKEEEFEEFEMYDNFDD